MVADTRCSICYREGVVYHRRYSGERLCGTCFVTSFERRVYKTIAKYRLLREDDRIAVGVSGGKDSLALLRVLSKIEKRFPRVSLVAITIDEGIPGYRDEALRIATKYCAELGVEHRVFSFRELFGVTIQEAIDEGVLNRLGLKPCSLCGVFRRKALNVAAREVGATVIATAHTLDDIVQTYFMNLLRGDMGRGLLGTRRDGEGFIPRVAPLRLTPGEEVVMYAYLCGISFQETPCPNSHSSQRNLIRDFLASFESAYPGSLFTALAKIEQLLLSSNVDVTRRHNRCKICGDPSTGGDTCRACEISMVIKERAPITA